MFQIFPKYKRIFEKDEEFFKKKTHFKQNFLILLKLNFDRLLTITTTKTDHDIT